MLDKVRSTDALLIIDVQVDRCPGGAAPVPGGDSVVPVLNDWLRAAEAIGATVVAVRDWHPADHCSFRDQGGSWPAHCVQDTAGAAFHRALELPAQPIMVHKGTARARDSESAFDDTGLAGRLHERGVGRIWVGGLAQDTAVRASVIDACEAGFDTHLIPAATRPSGAAPGRAERALEAMRAAGAAVEQPA